MYSTIIHNSGGNHGHQIKDLLGALTISKFFRLKYLHQSYDYLDFLGVQHIYELYSKEQNSNLRLRTFTGPNWNGFISLRQFLKHYYLLFVRKSSTCIQFEKACRVHPFQTILWWEKGYLKRNIFKELVTELEQGFYQQNPEIPDFFTGSKLNIAMHIGRGSDYDTAKFPMHFSNSYNVRYMFPIEYYVAIKNQLESKLGKENVQFHLFTEYLNSEEVIRAFDGYANVKLHIGKNRNEIEDKDVHSIFNAFVKADILVTCNSSFSVVATYFRGKKPTVYHPHKHLDYLQWPWYFKTKVNGHLDLGYLNTSLQKKADW